MRHSEGAGCAHGSTENAERTHRILHHLPSGPFPQAIPEAAKRKLDQRIGIDSCSVEANTKMEMRPSSPPGSPHSANDLSLLNRFTVSHEDLGEMEVHRIEPKPMIHNHPLASKEVVRGEPHDAIVHRDDWGP
jgi:hypothetical protein